MTDTPDIRGWEWRIFGKCDRWSAQLNSIYEHRMARYCVGIYDTPTEALEASIALYREDVAVKRLNALVEAGRP